MTPNNTSNNKMRDLLLKCIKSCYNYITNHKLLFFVIVALLASSIYGIISYKNYLNEKEKAEMANRYIIKRTFNGLSLGDLTEDAIRNIPSPNPRKITYSGEDISKVSVENVYLGKRLINNMVLYFYKNRLYKLIMYINISFEDYNNKRTFNHFDNLFLKSGYSFNDHNYDFWRDYYYDKMIDKTHIDIGCYSDKHTDLVLYNSYLNTEQPQIILTYYDRDSHYTEDIKKANEMLDTAFVLIPTDNNSIFL